jgi:hypothetical protein
MSTVTEIAFLEELFRAQNPDGGFPYLRGGESASEPSLLMLLGGLAQTTDSAQMQRLSAWVLARQNSDGSIGYSATLPLESRWLTALLAIACRHLGKAEERDRAVLFLERVRPLTFPRVPENDLDTTLAGWPWIEGTFSWVEPTCWALMALRVGERATTPRFAEGIRMLKDRCIPGAGWNYGNKAVYNAQLIPFWDTTALAVLALGPEEKAFCGPIIEVLARGLQSGTTAASEAVGGEPAKVAETERGTPGVALSDAGALCESLLSRALTCLCLAAQGQPVAAWREAVTATLTTTPEEERNCAHAGLALMALSDKKILTA